jgi:hypothetical protein
MIFVIYFFTVYQQLQGELSKVVASKAIQGNSVFQENVDCDKAQLDIIRKRKLSVEGQLKIIAQKEILKTLSHQETERSLRKKCDDLEDEFENSKHEIESQLGKIREIEEHYRHTDAIHYTEISKTVSMDKCKTDVVLSTLYLLTDTRKVEICGWECKI